MKKYLPAVSCLIILLCFCSGIVFLAQVNTGVSVPSSGTGSALPVIVIDPGHGGFDGGTTSVYGKTEKEYNLAISLILADFLRADGFTVVMTRTDDSSTEDPNLATIREKKSSDIRNRMDLMNTYENCLFISIHQNYFSDASCHGAQVFYSPNNPQSKILAQTIQRTIASLAEPDNTRAIKKSDSSIYLLHKAQRPAVLVECGFLSNPENALKLDTMEFQQKIAFAISRAVYHYIYFPEETHVTEE